MIDINLKTKDKTQALMDCSVRLLDQNNNPHDYKIDQGNNFQVGKHGERKDHPYIKEFIPMIEKSQPQKIVILNKDGSERLGPIMIPVGKIPVFRIRTRGGGSKGISKFTIVGIVDKTSQELHFLDVFGNETVETNPPISGEHSKINLMPEELVRL